MFLRLSRYLNEDLMPPITSTDLYWDELCLLCAKHSERFYHGAFIMWEKRLEKNTTFLPSNGDVNTMKSPICWATRMTNFSTCKIFPFTHHLNWKVFDELENIVRKEIQHFNGQGIITFSSFSSRKLKTKLIKFYDPFERFISYGKERSACRTDEMDENGRDTRQKREETEKSFFALWDLWTFRVCGESDKKKSFATFFLISFTSYCQS